jgi:hypothetical protein
VNVLRLPLLLGGALLAFSGAALVWEAKHRGERPAREETVPSRQTGVGG